MKLSSILLSAMLTSTTVGLAQETIKTNADSLSTTENSTKQTETLANSILLKKIDSLYTNRHKITQKEKTTSNIKKVRIHNYCPACGRG